MGPAHLLRQLHLRRGRRQDPDHRADVHPVIPGQGVGGQHLIRVGLVRHPSRKQFAHPGQAGRRDLEDREALACINLPAAGHAAGREGERQKDRCHPGHLGNAGQSRQRVAAVDQGIVTVPGDKIRKGGRGPPTSRPPRPSRTRPPALPARPGPARTSSAAAAAHGVPRQQPPRQPPGPGPCVQSAPLARISKVASHQRELVLPLPSAIKIARHHDVVRLHAIRCIHSLSPHARAMLWRPPPQRRFHAARRPCGVQSCRDRHIPRTPGSTILPAHGGCSGWLLAYPLVVRKAAASTRMVCGNSLDAFRCRRHDGRSAVSSPTPGNVASA